jgi:p24 family protein beta-1
MTDPLEKELEQLKDGLRAVKEEQQYIVVRERIHRNSKFLVCFMLAAESTNSRVMVWNVVESIALVAVCLWQVWYLKRFFEVKRSV